MAKNELSTQGVRAGQARTEFQEHAEALFLTSSFVFDSAAQAAARFFINARSRSLLVNAAARSNSARASA